MINSAEKVDNGEVSYDQGVILSEAGKKEVKPQSIINPQT